MRRGPFIRRQRLQSVPEPCAIALRTHRTEFPRRHDFAAHRRTLFVDAAMGRLPNDPDQRNAPRFGGGRCTHRQPVRIELFRQRQRYFSARRTLGFRPVERHTEKRAAGAATQAGMIHRTGQDGRAGQPNAHSTIREIIGRTRAIVTASRFTSKRIALSHVTTVKASLEPFHPLRRRAMRE